MKCREIFIYLFLPNYCLFSAKTRHSANILILKLKIQFLLVVTNSCGFWVRPSLEFFGWFCTFSGPSHRFDTDKTFTDLDQLFSYCYWSRYAASIPHSKYLCTGRLWRLLEDTLAGNLSSLKDYRILFLATTVFFPTHR